MKRFLLMALVLCSCAATDHPKFSIYGKAYNFLIENRDSIQAPLGLDISFFKFPQYMGTLTNLETRQPVDNARITLHSEKLDRVTMTDINGIFKFLIDEEIMGFTVEADDFPPVRMNMPSDFWESGK